VSCFPYDGSSNDVGALAASIKSSTGSGIEKIILVLDSEFASERNIDLALSPELKTGFIIALPPSMKFTRDQIEAVRGIIDSPNNAIIDGAENLMATSRLAQWDNSHEIKSHIFFNGYLSCGKYNDVADCLYCPKTDC
jgi:transposase